MMKITVKAVGYGLGYNTYHVEFSFTMNGTQDSWEDGEISRRIFNKARERTACDRVEIKETRIEENE